MELGIILLLSVGAVVLVFLLVKKVILPKRSEAAAGLVGQNNVRQAIKVARAAIEKDPKDVEAHYSLAKAYLADNRPDQAYRSLISVKRLGIEGKNIPETEFRQTIARLYAQNKEPEEALKEYLLLIKMHPENADYYFEAGVLFDERRRADLAEQYMKKAASLNPKNPVFLIELGIVMYQGKKLKDAEACLDKVLKMEPGNPKASYYLGRVHKEGKNYSGALSYFETSSRDQEYKVRSLAELGGCYLSLNMTDKAIADLERAVNAVQKDDDPDGLLAHYLLGTCYEKKQEFEQALAQWDKVYAKKKNFRDVGEKLTQYAQYRDKA